MIKGFSTIIKKDHRIDKAMNNQKTDKKKTGKPHCKFFTDRRSEKMFPGHIRMIENKLFAKIRHERQNNTLFKLFMGLYVLYTFYFIERRRERLLKKINHEFGKRIA